MADNKWTGSANRAADIIEDDDPFAALTRLVDADVAQNSVARQENSTPDFSFDLEDELLREFKKYDSGEIIVAEKVADFPADEEDTSVSQQDKTEELEEELDFGFADEAEIEALLDEAVLNELDVAEETGSVEADGLHHEDNVEFAGPTPDLGESSLDETDLEAAFSGPLPDVDFDLAPDFSAAPQGDQILDAFDFGDDAPEQTEESADDLMTGELEMSLGIPEVEEPASSEPVTAFAEWKNERLSQKETAWVPGPVLGQPGQALAETDLGTVTPAEEEVETIVAPQAVEEREEDLALDEPFEAETESTFDDPLVELQAIMAGSGYGKTTVTAQKPLESPAESDFDFDFDTLEMDLASVELDDDIPSEESAESEDLGELYFDQDQITEIEQPTEFMADLDVPSAPVAEKEELLVPKNEFDIEFEAEMAGLFGKSEPKAAVVAAKPADEEAAFERELEADIISNLKVAPSPGDFIDAEEYGSEESPVSVNRRGGRWMTLAAIAASVVVVGGAYAWINSGGSDGLSAGSDGEPPVVTADNSPFKEVPADKGGAVVPNQDKAVYDRVAGTGTDGVTQQSLITSNEQPLNLEEQTAMAGELPLEGTATDGSEGGITGEDRLLPGEQDAAPTAEASPTPVIAPRKVKTMIVMPDGTLVARETPEPEPEPAAEAETAVVSDVVEPVELASTPEVSSNGQTTVESAVEQAANAEVEATAPVRPVKVTTITPTPVPSSRPTEQPVNVVGEVSDRGVVSTPQATAEQPATPAPVETQVASVPTGTYVVQIASLTSEESARQTYNNLASRFSSVIGGRGVDIKRADIEGKGTYYRVRIPVGTREEAIALCERYKAAGGSCLVSK